MSLYNMVCGNNPLYQLLHAIIEKAAPLPEIPRFRDSYTLEEGGKPFIVIFTRTGGGNRSEYEAQNAALCAHPLFVRDFDADFDSTFAHFVYSVPEDWQADVLKVHQLFHKHPKGRTPKEKFEASLEQLKAGKDAPALAINMTDQEVEELAALLPDMAERLGLLPAG